MQTLAIPNIPEDLMDIMERRAAANGRAVEDEALAWLQSAKSGRALPVGLDRIKDAEPSDPKPAASDIPAPARKMRGINADKPK